MSSPRLRNSTPGLSLRCSGGHDASQKLSPLTVVPLAFSPVFPSLGPDLLAWSRQDVCPIKDGGLPTSSKEQRQNIDVSPATLQAAFSSSLEGETASSPLVCFLSRPQPCQGRASALFRLQHAWRRGDPMEGGSRMGPNEGVRKKTRSRDKTLFCFPAPSPSRVGIWAIFPGQQKQTGRAIQAS